MCIARSIIVLSLVDDDDEDDDDDRPHQHTNIIHNSRHNLKNQSALQNTAKG